MTPVLRLNGVYRMKGFFTKALYLRSQPAREVEVRLGYAAGRLAAGWWLLFLEQLPAPDEFEFRGYSQMSGGIPQGHLDPGGRNAEQRLRDDGVNVPRLKQNMAVNGFRVSGPERLAKVLPLVPAAGPMPYPPGSGIPQWELVKRDLPFRAAALIKPGETYLGDYT
jgi:hypothetical protein